MQMPPQTRAICMSHILKKTLEPNYSKLSKVASRDLISATLKKSLASAQAFQFAYPNDPLANFLLARAFINNENLNLALPHAQASHRGQPNNFEYIVVLGRLYVDLKLFEYAGPLFYRAMHEKPDSIAVQWAIGDFLYAINRGSDAKKHYEIALTLNETAEMKASLSFDYAVCLGSMNLFDQAENALVKFGEFPGNALKSLERRSRLRKYQPDSEMAFQVREALVDKTIDEKLRSELLLSLGAMYENAQSYDDAFSLWSQSRSLKIKKRDKSVERQIASSFASFYTKQLFSETKAFANESKRPIYIIGMPRSGTTLAEQVLAAHPLCAGIGELGREHRFESTFRVMHNQENHVAKIVTAAKAGELKKRGDEILSLLERIAGPTARHVIDKFPSHYFTLGFSALCFSNAKFIHTQRHPADSFISSFQNNLPESHEYSYDQEHYVEAYLAKEDIMAHWRECFPDRIFDLQYEKLVSKPEETVREVLKFLDLPWDENCMKFFEKQSMVKTFSTHQVRNPIYTTSVYRWKNYEKHLGPLFAALKAANFEYPELSISA